MCVFTMQALSARVTSASAHEYVAIIWVIASLSVAVTAYHAYVKLPRKGFAPNHRAFVLSLLWSVSTAVLATYLGVCLVFLPAFPALAILRDE